MRHRDAGAELLSEEAVKMLWAQFIESRAPALRARLIERYLGWRMSPPRNSFGCAPDHAVSFSDYLQYARLGLLEAIDGFDPTREASFETYSSYRIRGAMLNGLPRESEVAAQRTFWRTRPRGARRAARPAAVARVRSASSKSSRACSKGSPSSYFADERDDLGRRRPAFEPSYRDGARPAARGCREASGSRAARRFAVTISTTGSSGSSPGN